MNNQVPLLEFCLGQYKKDNQLEKLTNSSAFELYSTSLVLEQYNLSFSEIEEGIVGESQDGGIDGFFILVNGQAVVDNEQIDSLSFSQNTVVDTLIIQSKYESSFKETVLDKIITTMPLVFDLLKEENELKKRLNEELIEKIILFRKVWQNAVSKSAHMNIRYIYTTKANDMTVNKAFNSKVDQILRITRENLTRCNAYLDIFDAQRLVGLIQKPESSTLVIKFKETPVAIEFNDDELGYLGVVGVNEYCRFIIDDNNRIRENLFESNIRHFQGNVDVNIGIMTTLSEKSDKDFWWLNNGITMIASDCRPRAKELYIDNVQIVNGLQTSFALYKHMDALAYDYDKDESRSVLVKVIQTKKQETIDKIISASNSQTPVPRALLKATEKIQRDIEMYLLSKGFFYDRRKNYYKNQGKSASKIVSIQNLAQMYVAIVHTRPSISRASPTSIFRDDTTYNSVFNPSNPLKVYYICILLYNLVRDYIKNSELSREEKSFVKNFTYHWSRIIAALAIGKTKYNIEEISDIKEEILTEELVVKGYNILSELVSKYKSIYGDEDVANIAKSKSFNDFLNENLTNIIRE